MSALKNLEDIKKKLQQYNQNHLLTFWDQLSEAPKRDLLAQIQQLQAQLNAAQGGGSSMSTSYNFTRDLTVGSTGADVKALQQFLNAMTIDGPRAA